MAKRPDNPSGNKEPRLRGVTIRVCYPSPDGHVRETVTTIPTTEGDDDEEEEEIEWRDEDVEEDGV